MRRAFPVLQAVLLVFCLSGFGSVDERLAAKDKAAPTDKQIEKLTKEIGRLKSKIDGLERKVEKLEQEKRELRKKTHSQEGELLRREEEVAKSKRQLRKAQTEATELSQRIDELVDRETVLTEAVESLELQVEECPEVVEAPPDSGGAAPVGVGTVEPVTVEPPAKSGKRVDRHVVFNTSVGTIRCELYVDQVQKTTMHFKGLVRGTKPWIDPKTSERRENTPFYDGTEIHRIIPNALLQGGDRSGRGTGGMGETIDAEFVDGLPHTAGGLYMADAGDAASSQFFITAVDNDRLDGKYTLFGDCSGSLATIKKITNKTEVDVATKRPVTPILLNQVRIR